LASWHKSLKLTARRENRAKIQYNKANRSIGFRRLARSKAFDVVEVSRVRCAPRPVNRLVAAVEAATNAFS
jgi:hypothetical protein